jgi:hypothetical protein
VGGILIFAKRAKKIHFVIYCLRHDSSNSSGYIASSDTLTVKNVQERKLSRPSFRLATIPDAKDKEALCITPLMLSNQQCKATLAGTISYHHHRRQKSSFWTLVFLRSFCQICLHPVFISLDFARIFSFCKARSLALHPPPNLKDQVPVFISTWNRVAQLYSQALGSRLVALYGSQGGILMRLHMAHR